MRSKQNYFVVIDNDSQVARARAIQITTFATQVRVKITAALSSHDMHPSPARSKLFEILVALAAGWAALMASALDTRAAPLSFEQFEALSAKCAPSISVQAALAVARAESRLDPLALHDNTRSETLMALSVASAKSQLEAWLKAGDSVDVGLMQINSSNLSSLGLTVSSALDPCSSLKGGSRLLSAAYAQGASVAERQAAMLIALSRYNTGKSLAGLTNGYVGRVLAADAASNAGISNSSSRPEHQASAWDIWAAAAVARHRGAAWLIGSQGTPTFLIGAGAQSMTGEPYALSPEPETAAGL